jgi:hypothetical protein
LLQLRTLAHLPRRAPSGLLLPSPLPLLVALRLVPHQVHQRQQRHHRHPLSHCSQLPPPLPPPPP